MISLLISFSIFIVIALLLVGVTHLNSKTPIPKSCADMEPICKGCKNLGCGHKLRSLAKEQIDKIDGKK